MVKVQFVITGEESPSFPIAPAFCAEFFEKTQLIAQWAGVADNLRVCNQYNRYEDDLLNCGKCNKCVRTTLALEALGKLKGNRSFPYDQINADQVKKAFRHLNDVSSRFLLELIEPLQQAGRDDLAREVEACWDRYGNKENGRKNYKNILKKVKARIRKDLFKTKKKEQEVDIYSFSKTKTAA